MSSRRIRGTGATVTMAGPPISLVKAATDEPSTSCRVGIHWFRNGVRFHDNPSWLEACQSSQQYLLPLVILGSEGLEAAAASSPSPSPSSCLSQSPGVRPGIVRSNFYLESLADLNTRLVERDSKLVVVLSSRPLPEVMAAVARSCLEIAQEERELGATSEHTRSEDTDGAVCPAVSVFYEQDAAQPVRRRDAAVWEAVAEVVAAASTDRGANGLLRVRRYETQTLHPLERYAARCRGGTAPSTYGGFLKVFGSMGPVPPEADAVEAVPPLVPSRVLDRIVAILNEKKVACAGGKSNPAGTVVKVGEIPTLGDLGYTQAQILNLETSQRERPSDHLRGGETRALDRLRQMMGRTGWVATFEKPKTSPNALTFDTTGLSPYVKHGCLSPRTFYHELSKVYERYRTGSSPFQPKLSQPPVSLHGQLLWREYNYLMGYTTPRFDRMAGNPIARQIPWDDDPALARAWSEGRTGYPFVDAVMRQLAETGWIHHLARHAAACFLTRGDLWQSWEVGARVFEEKLVDADWSINNFNWQWLSCTAHFYQYFRCYSPVAFGKKTDPNGDYIRKWLPQFKTMPSKFIYEPWTAPIEVQRRCGVVVGVNYPHPIVDHAVISKSNMARMKAAYDAHNRGEANNGGGGGR